jgi:hypothetical protein
MKLPSYLTTTSTALFALLTFAAGLSDRLNPAESPVIARGLLMLPLIGIIMLGVHFYLKGIAALHEATTTVEGRVNLPQFFGGLIMTIFTSVTLIVVGFGVVPRLGELTAALLKLLSA